MERADTITRGQEPSEEEITPEMITAGVAELDYWGSAYPYFSVVEIYKAMRAATAPHADRPTSEMGSPQTTQR